MITLYSIPSTAGMAPHIVLREIGAPHHLVLLDGEARQQKAAEYLKLNPLGRVPTLMDGDLVVTEAAAICLHLADTHAQAGLIPPVGSAARARLYQWLTYLTNTVQAEMLLYFYPERYVHEDARAAFRATVAERLAAMFAHIDAALGDGPWLLGEAYGIADPYLFMLCRWTRFMERKARDLPNLGPYLARVHTRPAVRAALDAEGIGEPFY